MGTRLVWEGGVRRRASVLSTPSYKISLIETIESL